MICLSEFKLITGNWKLITGAVAIMDQTKKELVVELTKAKFENAELRRQMIKFKKSFWKRLRLGIRAFCQEVF
jgi:hypothetical protein